mgnify:CR=1 FL=1
MQQIHLSPKQMAANAAYFAHKHKGRCSICNGFPLMLESDLCKPCWKVEASKGKRIYSTDDMEIIGEE